MQALFHAGYALLGIRHEQANKHVTAILRQATDHGTPGHNRQRGGLARERALRRQAQRFSRLHGAGRHRLALERELGRVAVGIRHAICLRIRKAHRLRDEMILRLQHRTIGRGAHVQVGCREIDSRVHQTRRCVCRAVEHLRKLCLKALNHWAHLPLLEIGDRRTHAPLKNDAAADGTDIIDQHGLRVAEQTFSLWLPGREAVRLRDGECLFLHRHRNLQVDRFRAREYCAAVALDPVRERKLRLPVGAQAQAQPCCDAHLARIDRARIQRSERAPQPRPHVRRERLAADAHLHRQLHREAAQRAALLRIDYVSRDAALDLCALVRKVQIPEAERALRDHDRANIPQRIGHNGVHAAGLFLRAVKHPRVYHAFLLAQL